MAGTLSEFLLDNPLANETAEIYPSERFRTAGLPFRVRPISGKEFTEYQDEAASLIKSNRKAREVKFDTAKYHMRIILNHTVEPNFKDANLLEKAGVVLPEDFVNQYLKAGEIIEVVTQILALSGFDNDMDGLKGEVKNS